MRCIPRAFLTVSAFFALFAAPALAATDCVGLKGKSLSPSVTALPTAGGKITSSEVIRVGGSAYCRVKGEIAPAGLMGWPVLFQINLPENWNGKGAQIGGGGTNGVLVTAEGAIPGSPPTVRSPLQQGYATFGTDAGHPMLAPDPQLFALNDEAVVNHAHAAYKKTYDVAKSVIASYYGQSPSRMYFIGNSEGGREALMAAQRYPADYDGVLATVPAFNWAAQHLGHYREWEAQQDGGWMPPAKLQALQAAVLKACDKLDGLADGVVSQYERCDRSFDPKTLLCPNGGDTGDHCLSAPQLAFVQTLYSRKIFAFPLAYGINSYPGSPYGGEAASQASVIPSVMVSAPPKKGDLGRPLSGPGSVRFFFARDPAFAGKLDERLYKDRIQALSALFDSTDPNLRPFAARGGKLIMRESAADYRRSPGGSYDYYRAVVAEMGQAQADAVMRLYVAPGLGHTGAGVDSAGSALPDRVDLLSVLVDWVENGKAPGELVISRHEGSTNSVVRSWPLCRYPSYPRYVRGDVAQASSFRCTLQDGPG